MSDSGITTRINAKLISTKGISTFDINIDTYNGVVTVEGVVASYKLKKKVLQLCRLTEGVKKVISKLKVKK